MNSPDMFQNDAEAAILSIALQNPRKIEELKHIKDFMFSSSPNQMLFTTIQELSSQNLVPDVNLIDSYLKAQNRDLTVGGRDYLNYLFTQSFNQENVTEFERIVVDSYKARKLINISTQIPQKVSETTDINIVLDGVRKEIDNLTQTSGGDSTFTFEDTLKSSWEQLVERVRNPGINGVTTGLKSLDSITNGMNSGELWVVAGRPGMGKTAYFCNAMLKQGASNIPLLMFSLEMKKGPLVERMLAIETGVSSNDMRMGMLNQEKIDALSDKIKEIKDYPIHIDSNYFSDINYIVTTARRYKALHGIEVIYLDYLQLLAERTSDATNEIGRITRALKLLANDIDVSIVMGSQLSRGVEARPDKRPQLQDLRQSGNIEEDADIVLGLYRDVLYNKKTSDKDLLELLLLKHRNGPTGMLPVGFEQELTRMRDRL